MTVGQFPAEGEEFARYLRELTALLDTGAGWCGVFWQRDPDGMRACLDGTELPPWDVLEALLHDLAAGYGAAAAERETVRARDLHGAAAAARDRLPGGREALEERLGVMRREQTYAAEREQRLTRRRSASGGASAEPGPDVELAWARDDHVRATDRCAELGARLAALDALRASPLPGRAPAPDSWFRAEASAEAAPLSAAPSRTGIAPRTAHAHEAFEDRAPGQRPRGEAAQETPGRPAGPARAPKRRPRGARYAGLDEDDGSGASGAPAMPVPPVQAAAPRGARYAGVEAAEAPPVATATAQDTRAVTEAVAALVQLRAQGRTGEAHVLLCEAAGWPPALLPVLAGALNRAGLGADWATLLWEAASLPPDRVAAVAAALAGAGLGEDGRQLLRQSVVRPAPEIAAALLALDDAGGHEGEVVALADAFVGVRTPEEAAQVARADPRRLSPLLLDAARRVSQGRYRDVAHALRVAGAAP
ncbi:hypothetical protein AS594_07280 [Streptomyces agglomeratus]|uniref:UL36 very large tegument protein n=1 Tax=Streptomyces agglomeratus TaxID=285458 RepID=A0A1E5P456_9ACTN|nr:hypothetical protein [Streptomyces agglomeratus]OEJ24323.1 hypothetical protein AS594_07280 [Streptomyces agglomeratus]